MIIPEEEIDRIKADLRTMDTSNLIPWAETFVTDILRLRVLSEKQREICERILNGEFDRVDYERLRAANPINEFLAARGVQLRRSGSWWIGKCPIHGEQHGNAFNVTSDGLKAFCLGKCGTPDGGWDIVDVVQLLDGLTKQQAVELIGGQVAADAPLHHRKPRVSKPVVPTPALEPLAGVAREIRARAASRLYADRGLQHYLARRGWRRETVEAFAVEESLGWIDEWTFTDEPLAWEITGGKLIGRGGKAGRHGAYTIKGLVLFAYEHGLKYRYHRIGHPLEQEKEGRRIAWLTGKPSAIWRSGMDAFRRAKRVIITEGETDCITRYDLGQCQAGGAFIVALPSASGFRPEWAPLFKGKKVVVATDYDEAGRKAAVRTAEAVSKEAAEVCIRRPSA